MSIEPRVALAEPSRASESTSEWVLAVPLNDPGGGRALGAAMDQRGTARALLDGYLFDRDELAQATGLPADAPDAALLLGAYERWGESAFARLRGCFLAVVIDARQELAIVARDPAGSHPAFYAEANGSVMFATWPAPLLSQPGVSSNLNPVAMADHLCSRWPDRFETFYRDVRRIPPGWRAVVSKGRVRLERHWAPVPDTDAEVEWLNEEEIGRFGAILDRAVNRCLDVGRVGIYLSGGFDSVSIAAVASDSLKKTGHPAPLGLSIGFPDPTCDEQHVQRSVANALGMQLHLVRFEDAVGPRGLVAQAIDLSCDLPFPLFNCWAPAFLELARRGRADGIGSILTGTGGDESLGVTPLLAADLIRKGDLAGLVRFMKMWHRSYEHSWRIAIHGTAWRFGMRPLIGRMLSHMAPQAWNRNRVSRAMGAVPTWIAPNPAMRAEMRERAYANLVEPAPRGGFYAREWRDSLDHPMMSAGLEEQFFFGQRLGIRYMHPYWDADLATQIYRTRPEELLRGGRAKGLVRETVATRFPALGFERQRKVSAQGFFQGILSKEGPPAAKALGDLSALAEVGVLDPQRVRSFVGGAFDRVSRSQEMALHLFCMEAWTRKQLDSSSTRRLATVRHRSKGPS